MALWSGSGLVGFPTAAGPGGPPTPLVHWWFSVSGAGCSNA